MLTWWFWWWFCCYWQVGHTDSVVDVGFSVDGSLVATAALDNTVCVWNVEDGKLMATLDGPEDAVQWLAWHPKVIDFYLIIFQLFFFWKIFWFDFKGWFEIWKLIIFFLLSWELGDYVFLFLSLSFFFMRIDYVCRFLLFVIRIACVFFFKIFLSNN